MGITYKFYVQMDGQQYGPYTAYEVSQLGLLDDILVTEESMNGQWLPACRFDFDDMVRKERGEKSEQSCAPEIPKVNGINLMEQPKPQNLSQHTNYIPSPIENVEHNASKNYEEELNKWNWGAFTLNWLWGVCNGVYWTPAIILINLIPYVGQILSFAACVYLGLKGTKIAWEAKQNTITIESFLEKQHKWNVAGLWILGIMVIIIAIGIIATI